MAKVCSYCNTPGHTKFYCRSRPRKPLKRISWPKGGPTPHRIRWSNARQMWIIKHGDEHLCHYCGVRLTNNDDLLEQDAGMRKLTLDHLEARSGAPELRYEESNLVPACNNCNNRKGSRSHDQYEHTCYTALPVPSPADIEV